MERPEELVTVRARFKTHERAARVYEALEPYVHPDLPVHDDADPGHPWLLVIAYTSGQQALVLASIYMFGGVTWSKVET